MTSIVVSGVLGVCGTAVGGGAFTILGSLDASDNPAVQGAAITTDGTFYQDMAFGTSNPPTSAFIGLVGDALEFDSYIALDGGNANGQGEPSTASYTANAATTALPTDFTANSVNINAAFSMPGTGIDAVHGSTGLPQVFFARLTVQGGSGGISAPSVVVNLDNGGGGLITLDLTTGIENAVSGGDGNAYYIHVEQQETAFGTVNDLYVVGYIPAPGAAGLLGLAGFAVARRRRG
jgi:hypothetical protein